MNDRPTLLELLEAAREHLQREVVPAIDDPQLRFRTLVAAHVIAVCMREISANASASANGSTSASTSPATGSLHDGRTEPALCEAIRAGEFDADPAALLDSLQRDVESSLALWNPAFLARVR